MMRLVRPPSCAVQALARSFAPSVVLGLVLALVLCAAASSAVAARELPPDPLGSVMWKSMAERFMPDGDIVFDDRVRVSAPYSAENQFHVPVTVDASALHDVVEIVAVADLNPIPLILRVEPQGALPFVGFRLKLQQTSPVHVGVRTADGTWHVAGTIVDAMGGGCTAPAAAHSTASWMDRLGETRALARSGLDGDVRMTMQLRHPMDTGLAAGIPAFYLNELTVADDAGETLARLWLYEPVSENPTLTLKPGAPEGAASVEVTARDTEGNEYGFAVPLPAPASAAVEPPSTEL